MAARTASPALANTPGTGGPARKSTSSSSSSPAPTPSASSLPDLSTLLNTPIKVTVAATGDVPQRDLEGALFTYDSSFVVLASTPADTAARPSSSLSASASSIPQPTNAPRRTFHFLRTSQITSVSILPSSPLPLPSLSTPLPLLSTSQADLESRIDRAVASDRSARARIGQDVSSEAQALFDAFAKTLPVRWAGKSIVVMDEVVVEEPYAVGNVKGAKGSGERVERVKKILQGLRTRLGLERAS
ncbi:RNA-processing, Lsm domain protein [Rhodotorula toruloides]|uniref:RNA-processing, Lsm domain protein n=1 Tax=Rhodotorula toruloides TaxID=5286 RepID=A0A511K853_RHOTO|nr:RNA-processing, Lsm domain protein [Rhodotorula toruloides]